MNEAGVGTEIAVETEVVDSNKDANKKIIENIEELLQETIEKKKEYNNDYLKAIDDGNAVKALVSLKLNASEHTLKYKLENILLNNLEENLNEEE